MAQASYLRAAALTIALFSAVAASPALAGQSCRENSLSVEEFSSAINVAGEVRDVLNRTSDAYALIARVGDDVSEHGLKYTHMGIARRVADSNDWLVVHQLNPCASRRSELRVHGLVNFMLDDLLSHDVLVVSLGQALEIGLQAVFGRDGPLQIYDPQYSMISYPGSPAKYQNSNQWILEIIAQAQAEGLGGPIIDRATTHTLYAAQGYKGTIIRISPFRIAAARLFADNVRFDDHPIKSQRRGEFEVVSVRSIVEYVRRTGDAVQVIEIKGAYRRPQQEIPKTIRD